MSKKSYIPGRTRRFNAFDAVTGRPARSGPFKCIGRNTSTIEAVDLTGQQRKFSFTEWRFEKVTGRAPKPAKTKTKTKPKAKGKVPSLDPAMIPPPGPEKKQPLQTKDKITVSISTDTDGLVFEASTIARHGTTPWQTAEKIACGVVKLFYN